METRDDTRPLSPAAGRDVRDDRIEVGRDVPDVRTASERAAMRHGGGEADDSRSIASLIKELRDESTTLIRQELALARTEMSEKASKAGRNAAYAGGGAVLMYLGAFFALAAASVGLAMLLNRFGADPHGWWLGPLIVGAIVGIIGAVITSKGVKTLKNQSLVPEKTVQSLQEDKQWLQDKVTP